jgi:hypothetical protein
MVISEDNESDKKTNKLETKGKTFSDTRHNTELKKRRVFI